MSSKTNFPKVGNLAPQFSLQDQNDETVSLKDFKGKSPVLVYFYPKAMTPGCTVQACSIRDSFAAFKKAKVAVVGVSIDTPDRLKKFEEKEDLNFTLLSDADHAVSEKYGVWQKKKNYGKEYLGIVRTSFLVGKDGKLLHVFENVKTKTHHQDVLDYVRESKDA
ncbi:MAG: thioredoxin-dependent thiol peroxidase [Oligoflexales bacterium]